MSAKVGYFSSSYKAPVGRDGEDVLTGVISAYYRFSQRRLTMEVVAYRTIEMGEEIVMSCKSPFRD